MKLIVLPVFALLAVPAMAAEPVYHDCRLSEDIVRGHAVRKTVCQTENGDWVEVHPPNKKPRVTPTALTAKPVKKPVYHDCRPSEDIVNGHTVHKTICQNEKGDWVEPRP